MLYITKKGLSLAAERERVLRESLKEGNQEAAKAYNQSGDAWHDNPGWYAAIQQKGFSEGKLKDFLETLGRSVTIDDLSISPGVVSPGSVVELDYNGDVEIYTLLGWIESSPQEGILDSSADLPQILMGKKIGDDVEFRGARIKILNISRWDGLEPK